MDVWIIRDGEKVGPIHDFEVRRKISDGDLEPTTPAWHDGLAGWKTLVEIDLFRREFELVSASQDTPAGEDGEAKNAPQLRKNPLPPPLPVKPCYIRRFWARWFDLSLYSAVWWFGMWAAGQNIDAALQNPWIMFLRYVPWFVLEALLIHHHATTPGKWLLGLHVVNVDASRLDLAASTRRSMQVLFGGIGFGWHMLSVFCQGLSYFVALRLGNTLWDHSGGHRIDSKPVSPLRVTTFVLLFGGAIVLQTIVVVPYVFEATPELKEKYGEIPFWHLPKRS